MKEIDFNKLLKDFVEQLRETHPYKDEIGGQMNLMTEVIAANVCVNLLARYHELLRQED